MARALRKYPDKVLISRETLHWMRGHIARCNASEAAINETLIEIDEALGVRHSAATPHKGEGKA